MTEKHHSIVIVGGGTGGLSVAARLLNEDPTLDVAILEPSDKHYYQPIWTLVGGGVFPKEISEREEADYIPDGATWIREAVATFEPEARALVTQQGTRITYDQLVVAAGIQLDWHKIEGLEGHLGKDGICSNYLYSTVESTWEFLRGMKRGNAVFTFPSTPIKCAGAPQKIMYLADDHLRRAGVRDDCKVIYASASPGIFGVERYAKSLRKIVERKQIETHFQHDLVAVKPDLKKAVFRDMANDAEVELDYELLHVVPPQSAPDFIKQSRSPTPAGGSRSTSSASSTRATPTSSRWGTARPYPAPGPAPRSASRPPCWSRTCSPTASTRRSREPTTATPPARSSPATAS